ncbi:fumarylacetoacetate hydrolase family protein [Actinocorallia populi]|uniref:fumarylacetoacetate hydrolase family protein n=1 Tax=Actinocorallia populi TaxID=2079200 RepID=UPI000D088CE9|nr:fumarylacetoacetate hydrolase family protein [Actinocorallia populi]
MSDTPATTRRFALGTFTRSSGGPFAGLVVDDRVLPLSDVGLMDGPVTVRGILEQWQENLPRLEELAQSTRDTDGFDLRDLRVLPPVAPRHIIQAGANYRAHLLEMATAQARAAGGDDAAARAAAEQQLKAFSEGRPFLFIGLPSAMCGAHDDILLPEGATQPDWEAELAVVIGRPARHVTPEQALEHVAGYTVCNDISARDWQFPPEHRALGGDWLRAKNQPTFLPTGPFIVPARFVPDPSRLHLTLKLNGQTMQDETADDMIFDVARLVAEASASVRLLPGDLVLTGSPKGNGGHWKRFLRPGDVLEAAIDGIGAQHNRCVPA